MPSPFPGMDPYLEQPDVWEDFHSRYIVHVGDQLAARVGSNYAVKVEECLSLHELSAAERRFIGRADLGINRRGEKRSGVAVMETSPATMQLELPAVEIVRERFLEIVDRRERRVVTVIEMLSPTNKRTGSDRDDYLAKRRNVLATGTHLVELDLLRGGSRPEPPQLPSCDYAVIVSRYEQRPKVDIWTIGLRERLPLIPIPLSLPDPDIALDIKAVLDHTYDLANYRNYLYENPPTPPLVPNDSAWAQALIVASI